MLARSLQSTPFVGCRGAHPASTSAPACLSHSRRQQRSSVGHARHVTAAANGASPVSVASTSTELKAALQAELQGTDRGIFGTTAAKKAAIIRLIEQLEAQNPNPNATDNLELAAGDWKLLYSTIVITGSKKTKLGLREFIKLGDFIQSINLADKTAVNTVQFSVTGLGKIQGALTIRASYDIADKKRVNIKYLESSLVPAQLQAIFEKNLDLLLSIFNPEGYLDITYLDDQTRVGRDDKGNIFLVEKVSSA